MIIKQTINAEVYYCEDYEGYYIYGYIDNKDSHLPMENTKHIDKDIKVSVHDDCYFLNKNLKWQHAHQHEMRNDSWYKTKEAAEEVLSNWRKSL